MEPVLEHSNEAPVTMNFGFAYTSVSQKKVCICFSNYDSIDRFRLFPVEQAPAHPKIKDQNYARNRYETSSVFHISHIGLARRLLLRFGCFQLCAIDHQSKL